jgi:para-aminobenzoate synthetase / 4-amino-4-deoxychorismate lyase
MARDAHPAALRLDGPAPDPAAGVFSTTLVVAGRAVEIDAHLARLEASLRALYGEAMPADARSLIEDGAADLELGRLRLTVVPGTGPDVRVAAVDAATVFPGWDDAASLATVVVPGWNGAHKWADRRMLDRAQEQLGAELPLLLDPDGSVLEASRSNLFAVHAGAVTTPPLDGRVLPGIARARAIEVARAAGIEVTERQLGIAELADADEVFLTGGVRGVEPVARLRGVCEWDSGGLTAQVAAELQRAWLGTDTSS